MRFSIVPDHTAMSRAAAARVREVAEATPALLLCAASGGTPTDTYAALAATPAVFAAMRVIKLDEWAGLPMDHPATCEHYLRRTLLDPLGIPAARYIGFRADAPDHEAECARVRAALAEAGPIDLCILGLGRNGHIALNEPARALSPFCHVATLAPGSRMHPMLTETGATVSEGMTLGLAEILQARRVLLLISGPEKRGPLARLASRRIETAAPASFLWLHRAAEVICDAAAAADLDLPDG